MLNARVQIKQQPTYLDKEKLDAAIGKLRVLPGLVQPVRDRWFTQPACVHAYAAPLRVCLRRRCNRNHWRGQHCAHVPTLRPTAALSTLYAHRASIQVHAGSSGATQLVASHVVTRVASIVDSPCGQPCGQSSWPALLASHRGSVIACQLFQASHCGQPCGPPHEYRYGQQNGWTTAAPLDFTMRVAVSALAMPGTPRDHVPLLNRAH